MNKKVFGTAWWIQETKEGSYALLETEINVGDKSLSDLTDSQLREADISLFKDRESAESERIKRVLKTII